MASEPKEKRTAAEVVAEQIIEMINDPSGVPSWRKPWMPPPGPRRPTNAFTGNEYRGANNLVMALGRFKGQPAMFGTFNQWRELGEKEGLNLFVKKDEKSLRILVPIFKKDPEDLDANGEPKQKLVGTKLAFGFHYTQTQDGQAYFEKLYGDTPVPKFDTETLWPVIKERIQEMVSLQEIASNRAFYRPGTNEIFLPQPGQFETAGGFYGTILHELTHATEKLDEAFQKSLTDQKLNKDDKYAYCELRAELGSMLLAQTIGVPMESIENNASYIEGWGLRQFAENHKKMIVQAANYAQNAVDIVCTPEFLLALQERRNETIKPDVNLAFDLEAPKAADLTGPKLSITPEDLDAGKRYTFTADPSHGWLVVPMEDVQALGIGPNITPFSYVSPKGTKVYLEEDCDARLFVDAYAERYGIEITDLWKKIANSNNIDRAATCRQYEPFDSTSMALSAPDIHNESVPLTASVGVSKP